MRPAGGERERFRVQEGEDEKARLALPVAEIRGGLQGTLLPQFPGVISPPPEFQIIQQFLFHDKKFFAIFVALIVKNLTRSNIREERSPGLSISCGGNSEELV